MSSWNEFKVSELAHVNKAVVDKNYPHDEILYLDVASTNQGRVTELQSLKLKEAPSRAKRILTNNDFVISTVRPNLKHYAFIKKVAPNAVASTGYAVITAKEEICDPRFLYYLLTTQEYTDYLTRIADGHTSTYPSFNPNVIENTVVKIPNLNIQNKISDILGTLDDKIELNNQINETLESIAKAIFKEWFIDFGPVKAKAEGKKPFGMDDETAALFPDSFEDSEIGLIPKGWEIKTFRDVSNCFDSKRVPLSGAERERRKGIYPYYGAASHMGNVDDFLFDGIYVLMGEDGSVVNEDGSPVLQYVWGKFWVNNHAHVLTGEDISSEHLLLFLKHTIISPYVTGAVQPKLNQGNMNRIPFVKAPTSINSAFAKLIEPLFAKIRANKEENDSLTQTRDLLLPKLISGEIQLNEVVSD